MGLGAFVLTVVGFLATKANNKFVGATISYAYRSGIGMTVHQAGLHYFYKTNNLGSRPTAFFKTANGTQLTLFTSKLTTNRAYFE